MLLCFYKSPYQLKKKSFLLFFPIAFYQVMKDIFSLSHNFIFPCIEKQLPFQILQIAPNFPNIPI